MHAIFGASQDCIATHASDLAVALLALDAILHVRGRAGDRSFLLADFIGCLERRHILNTRSVRTK